MKKILKSILVLFLFISSVSMNTVYATEAEVIADSTYFTETSEVVSYVKNKLVNRETTISFTLVSSANNPITLYKESIEPYIYEHTGTPKEGDNLSYQIGERHISVSGSSSNGTYVYNYTLTFSAYTSASEEEELDEKVAEVIASLDLNSKTDYEKVCAIYDYITQHVSYDYDNLNDDTYYTKYTAYAALCHQKSVCQGFANLFYRLALEAGLDCRIIDGYGNGGAHAWNIVKLGSKYYNLDCTWDSQRSNYDWFLKGSETFEDHASSSQFLEESFVSQYPISTSDYDPTIVEEVPITSVSLNKSTLSLEEGNTETLTATISPSNTTDDTTLTWTSSNTSVASVSNGKVTAKSAGTATITVTTTNGKTATCTVTVTEKEVPITSVTLNKSTLTLEEGDTETLTATINPSNTTDDTTLTWTSSNTNVASVTNGTVTAINAGTTTITVTTTNGKTATCTVTVTEKEVPITSVTLNKSTLTLEEGNTATLTATINPSNTTDDTTLTWTSSNTNVASVSNGKVTAKNAGTATITVKTSNGKTATCTVTVTEKEVPITSVSLNKSTLTLEEGNTETLTATINPSNTTDDTTFTWTSSNTNVATVSNGKVTAKNAGTATIIVKTSNGKTATCTVTVTEKEVPITSVSLNKSTLSLEEGNTETLTATISPSNTTDDTALTWTSSNTNVATVSNGKVTAISAGTATITVKTSNGKTATCTVTVKYPNPYDDVAEGKWYTEPILRAAALGIMTGKTDTHFGTTDPLSRAAMATVLYRLAGEPSVEGEQPSNEVFPDVSNTWYTKAITWAYTTGIVTGHGNGTFKPNDGVTRQQLALMLQRYAKEILGEDVSVGTIDFSQFSDGNEVASWAREAMQWAIDNGIISGNDNGTLKPKGTVSRAQCAVMLMRFYDQFIE